MEKYVRTNLKTDTAPLLPAETTIGDVWQNNKQDKILFSSCTTVGFTADTDKSQI
jgi:hypothetical protein